MNYIKRLYDKVPEDLHFKPIFKAIKEQGKYYIRLIKSDLDDIWPLWRGALSARKKISVGYD
jgi:hypothetical protein